MSITLPTMKVKCEECKEKFERYTYNGENVQKYWCPECIRKAQRALLIASNPTVR